MADESATVEKPTYRDYVVLESVDGNGTWAEVDRISAPNNRRAIELAFSRMGKDQAELVAVSARTWKSLTPSRETKTVTRWG
jgi:hypothetical protein